MSAADLDYVAPKECDKCPRLYEFIRAQDAEHGDWYNGAVPAFGSREAEILIVGLAPGLKAQMRLAALSQAILQVIRSMMRC